MSIADEITEIQEQMNHPDFWNDKQRAQQQIARLQALLQQQEHGGESSGPYDTSSAFITIMAGAGGDDAEDFVRMLYEMYQGYSTRNGYTCTLQSATTNTVGGFRSVCCYISGFGAYGALRRESGVHRLIRISPFNAKGKRQTSFAMVEVVPELPKTSEYQIRKEDLDIQFTRSGGPGGQNVNKRETAVRITHIPSGISVHVDSERTQESNRDIALRMIQGKLAIQQQQQQQQSLEGLQVSKTVANEWGSQIRTYTLHPYQLVKDHRTGVEITAVDAVLRGDRIEELVESLS